MSSNQPHTSQILGCLRPNPSGSEFLSIPETSWPLRGTFLERQRDASQPVRGFTERKGLGLPLSLSGSQARWEHTQEPRIFNCQEPVLLHKRQEESRRACAFYTMASPGSWRGGAFPRIPSVGSNLCTGNRDSVQPVGSHVASSVPVCEDLHAGSLFLHLHAEPFTWLPKGSNVFQISYCPKVWPEFGHQEYDGISSQFFPALLLRGGGGGVQAALHGRGSLHLQHPESWAWPWVFIQPVKYWVGVMMRYSEFT